MQILMEGRPRGDSITRFLILMFTERMGNERERAAL